MLARNTTWTMERETKLPLRFVGISYHDGQGFIVKKLLGVTSALNLSGAAICFQTGTTTRSQCGGFLPREGNDLHAGALREARRPGEGLRRGQVRYLHHRLSQLYAVRLRLANPEDAMVLPDVISKEPLGPVVRQGDEQWFNIVRWTLFALVNAEELEVTAASVDELKAKSQERRRAPPAGRRRHVRRRHGARRRLGAAGHQGDGQLRRNLRSQPRQELAAIERGINGCGMRRPALHAAVGSAGPRLPDAANSLSLVLRPRLKNIARCRPVSKSSQAIHIEK